MAEVRKWKDGVPVIFRNRPPGFVAHLQKRIEEAEKTIIPEMVQVTQKTIFYIPRMENTH